MLPQGRRGCYVSLSQRGNFVEVLEEYAKAEGYGPGGNALFGVDAIVRHAIASFPRVENKQLMRLVRVESAARPRALPRFSVMAAGFSGLVTWARGAWAFRLASSTCACTQPQQKC